MIGRLLSVLALAGVMLAGGDPLCADGPAVSNGAVELAHKFTPGEATRYKITQRLTGSSTFPGAAKPVPVDTELSSTIRVRCIRSLENGAAEIGFETESGSLKIAGRPPRSFPASKEAGTVRVTPRGRIIKTEQEDGRYTEVRRFVMETGLIERIVILAALPGRAVGVGDSWSAETPMPLSLQGKLKLDSALKSTKQVDGGMVAVIKQVQSTIADQDSATESALPSLSQDGEVELLFAIDGGKLLSAKGTMRSTLVRPVKLPAVPSADAAPKPVNTVSTLMLNRKFTIELLSQ